MDPKDLNKAIKRPYHCIPTIDEILPKLNGAKYLSIVDARSSYLNIKLDYESSLYTTFKSIFTITFWLNLCTRYFLKKVDEAFGNLPGVTGIADDIVVSERSRTEHDKNLISAMERARETGIYFNPDKCRIACTELPFFGHLLTASGLQADPRKIEAIHNMDPSTCLADL